MAGDEAILKIVFSEQGGSGGSSGGGSASVKNAEQKVKEQLSISQKMGKAYHEHNSKMGKSLGKGLGKSIGSVGGGAAGEALGVGGEALGAFAAEGLAALGPVGIALGVAVAATAATVGAFGLAVKKATDYFLDMAQKLAPFSANLGQSMGQDVMRKTNRSMIEAQTLGPGIAKLYDSTSKMTDMLADGLLPLKEGVLQVLVPIVEIIEEIVRTFHMAFMAVVEGVRPYAETAYGWFKQLVDMVKALIVSMQKWLGDIIGKMPDKKQDDFSKFLDDTINAFGFESGFVNDPVTAGDLRRIQVPNLMAAQ